MKIKASLILVLLAGSVFTFTGCKKSSTNPSGPALTPKQVTSQLALNLNAVLYDGFGAFNLNGGLGAPGNLGLINTHGLKLNDIGDPLCGTMADTTLNYSVSENGVQASVKGNIKISFICASGILSGFNITDNLAVGESSSDYSLAVKLIEDLTLAAQNPQNDNSNLTLNGTFTYDGTYNYKSGNSTQNFSYTFNSIVLDSSGEILSGSATFATNGNGKNGVWNYSGSIKFLGGGNATVTINGAVYNVNIETGSVS
ncbi:MAG: hypothetical protein JST19_19835 [Bacteroidetes bacterium]|nr:hypothetical protein [Bacteroidota bacterium]